MRSKLNEVETAKRADELAEAIGELADIKAQAREAAKEWRGRIEAMERRVQGLALAVRLRSDEAQQLDLDLVTGEVTNDD